MRIGEPWMHSSVPMWVRLWAMLWFRWAEIWEAIGKWIGNPLAYQWWYDLVDRHCDCEHCNNRRAKGLQQPRLKWWQWN